MYSPHRAMFAVKEPNRCVGIVGRGSCHWGVRLMSTSNLQGRHVGTWKHTSCVRKTSWCCLARFGSSTRYTQSGPDCHVPCPMLCAAAIWLMRISAASPPGATRTAHMAWRPSTTTQPSLSRCVFWGRWWRAINCNVVWGHGSYTNGFHTGHFRQGTMGNVPFVCCTAIAVRLGCESACDKCDRCL